MLEINKEKITQEMLNKLNEEQFNYAMAPYPDYDYENAKLLGVREALSCIGVFGEDGVNFFNNGFSGNDSDVLWSGHQRSVIPNPFSCPAPSIHKRMIEN